QGTIPGSSKYMAEARLKGIAPAGGSALFAFGCMLYDLPTGRKAFEGKTRASLLGAILKDDPPPVSTFQPLVSPTLDRIVATCLAKDPDDRWQTARDLLRELKWEAERRPTPTAPGGAGANPPRATSRQRLWMGAAIALALTPVALAVAYFRPSRAEAPLYKMSVLTPENIGFSSSDAGVQLAVSPDGRRLAFVASPMGARPQLWIRELDALTA